MDTKLEGGHFALSPTGLPETVTGKEELLQYARLRLQLRRGAFPYDRQAGSGLWQWTREGEHAADRALALANEALLGMPGVRAVSVEIMEGGAAFRVATPLGEGEITLGDL